MNSNKQKNPFRNKAAKKLYNIWSQRSDITSCGIDDDGKVFFVRDDKTFRYTRREFIDHAMIVLQVP
jgi:hypothetical protein